MIEPGKLADIREESERVIATRGDSWSPTYVKNRASITLELLDEIERLRGLVVTAPFEVGDIVREVGEEELTGEIIQIKHTPDGYFETAYIVKLYKPTVNFKNISYYHDEIELIERPKP